jgi:hypothetical protein
MRNKTKGFGAGMAHAGIKPDRPEWAIPAPKPAHRNHNGRNHNGGNPNGPPSPQKETTGRRKRGTDQTAPGAPWHRLYFLPDPQ